MQRASLSSLPLDSLASGQAEVFDMSPYYSAHADQQMLLDFLFRTDCYGSGKPATVFLNHGNPASKYALREAVRQRADSAASQDRKIMDVRIADARWFDLDTGEPIEGSSGQAELLREVEALRSQLRQLTVEKVNKDSFTASGTSALRP